MISIPFTLTPEAPDDSAAVEHLLDLSFGLSRRTKTTYRLREGERPVPGLSFVARDDAGRVVGAPANASSSPSGARSRERCP